MADKADNIFDDLLGKVGKFMDDTTGLDVTGFARKLMGVETEVVRNNNDYTPERASPVHNSQVQAPQEVVTSVMGQTIDPQAIMDSLSANAQLVVNQIQKSLNLDVVNMGPTGYALADVGVQALPQGGPAAAPGKAASAQPAGGQMSGAMFT